MTAPLRTAAVNGHVVRVVRHPDPTPPAAAAQAEALAAAERDAADLRRRLRAARRMAAAAVAAAACAWLIALSAPARPAPVTGWTADTDDTLLRPTADAHRLRRVGQYAAGPGWVNMGQGQISAVIRRPDGSAGDWIARILIQDPSDVRALPPSAYRFGGEDWLDIPRAESGARVSVSRIVAGDVDALTFALRAQAARGLNNGQTACAFSLARSMARIERARP